MQKELFVFMIFILNGFLLGIIFDCFRILRKSFKTPDLITYIEDILYGIISGLLILYSIMKFNSGELRLYLFIGIILGVTLYLLVFSKIYINISVSIILFIKKVIRIIVIIPIKYIYKIIRKIIFKPITFIFLNIRKIIKNITIKNSIFKISTKKLKNKKE